MIKCNRKMFVCVAAVGSALVMSGCGGRAVIPTSYNTYNAKDGSFKLEHPAGWAMEDGGKSGYAWVKFTSGSAEISVDANVVGSLIADIAKGHGRTTGPQDDPALAPVAAVHEYERKAFEEDGTVKEQNPVPVLTGMSDARKSEYTGKRTFGGAIHGCRVTALSATKRIRVVCQCSEAQWEALKPAFDKAIVSLAMGQAHY